MKKMLFTFLTNFYFKDSKRGFIPTYKIIDILKTPDDKKLVMVQVINKDITFTIDLEKINEILADNAMTNQFSPCDIRTLTYLGYDDMHAPKYTILDQHFAENTGKMSFSLKIDKRRIIEKTADEIVREKDIINKLSNKDSQLIFYVLAKEQFANEQKQKNDLILQRQCVSS